MSFSFFHLEFFGEGPNKSLPIVQKLSDRTAICEHPSVLLFQVIQNDIPRQKAPMDEYIGGYMYYIGFGMSLMVLLVLICYVLGLFYGFCGNRPGNVYGDDCCNRGTGANWLLAAVYLTFLFRCQLFFSLHALWFLRVPTLQFSNLADFSIC